MLGEDSRPDSTDHEKNNPVDKTVINKRRRAFLKTTVLGGLGGVSMGSIVRNASADELSDETLLDEDFEYYDVGSYPSEWRKNGNGDQRIVDYPVASGNRALRLKGVPGGCWEALANREVELPNNGMVRISGRVRPTTEGREGCHSKHASVVLRTSDASWDTGNGRVLMKFKTNGSVVGPDDGYFGEYTMNRWNSFEIAYDRSANGAQISYAVNGIERGDTIQEIKNYEYALKYLQLGSGDFTAYWDYISVTFPRM
jgi:hypothetical protein